MRKNFEKLNQEIEKVLKLLEYFETILIGSETDCSFLIMTIKDKDSCESIFKSLKSNIVLMLYNFVESTVRLTMNIYYDDFNSKKESYSNVVEELKRIWVKHTVNPINSSRIQQQVFEMIESAIDSDKPLSLDFENFSLSGNADLKEIKEILKNHGMSYEDDQFKTYGGSLKSVKDMRNSLSHGNISFEDNGKILTVNELGQYKKQTYECLDYFMKIVEDSTTKKI